MSNELDPQFRMQEAQDNEPAGLASLANPATPLLGARRAPGLGALAPTVQITRLVQQVCICVRQHTII